MKYALCPIEKVRLAEISVNGKFGTRNGLLLLNESSLLNAPMLKGLFSERVAELNGTELTDAEAQSYLSTHETFIFE